MRGWKSYERHFEFLPDIEKKLDVAPATVLSWARHDDSWPVDLVFLHTEKRKGRRLSYEDYILPRGAYKRLVNAGFPKRNTPILKVLKDENESLRRLLLQNGISPSGGAADAEVS